MKRREFAALVDGVAVACSRTTTAQTSAKTYRLGTLSPGAPVGENSQMARSC